MLRFVNAKINIGLQVVERRPDGYHNLQSIFYPIGIYAGSPSNPTPFPDLLEVVPLDAPRNSDLSQPFSLLLAGRPVDCPPEKNLVFRAASLFYKAFPDTPPASITLEKHLPDGAGIGGGSADAAFTLRMLQDFRKEAGIQPDPEYDDTTLYSLALSLGADVPFFLLNKPAYVTGVGECLQPIDLDLTGYRLLLVKPDVYVSTRQAFAGITPRKADFDLSSLTPPANCPGLWTRLVHNDFEDSIFPQFPVLADIKDLLANTPGALYASLTGSGSCLYAIYDSREAAAIARRSLLSSPLAATISHTWLLDL